MDWIKKNLTMVVSGVVALLLLGGAGYFLFSQWQLDAKVDAELKDARATWERLEKSDPHPGTDEINNIKAIQQDVQKTGAFLTKVSGSFHSLTYPVVTNNFQFKTLLEQRIDLLRKRAEESGVTIPQDYSFTFKAQMSKMRFEAEDLQPLANQLEEITALSELLFSQRVHSIEAIRRVAVAKDDSMGGNSYIPLTAVTNDLVVITPYEVTIKGFSSEMAGVLQAFANADSCYRITAINVATTELTDPDAVLLADSDYGATPAMAGRYAPTGGAATPGGRAADFARTYGIAPGGSTSSSRMAETYGGGAARANPYGGGGSRGEGRYGAANRADPYGLGNRADPYGLGNRANPYGGAQATGVTPNYRTAPRAKGEVIKENPLEVTLLIQFIRLIPTDVESNN